MPLAPQPALQTKLQALVTKQLKYRWTPPGLARNLQASVDSVAKIGVTIKLADPKGNNTAPAAGRPTDPLSLGVGVRASVAAKISLGLSLGIGISATASLLLKVTAGLHRAISHTNDLERHLSAFNAQAAPLAGTYGVMPPGRRLELGDVNRSLRTLNGQLAESQGHAYAAAAALPVSPIQAELRHPRMGAWRCDLDLDIETRPAGKIRFELDDLEFVGTVIESLTGTDGQRGKCQVVAGNGNLSQQVQAHSYSATSGVKVGTVVADILRECGEDLSDLSDQEALDKKLPRWHVSAGTAQQALTRLAEATDCAWRVMRDGTVWFGEESWPEVEPAGTLTSEEWSQGHIELASETPNMVPGTVYQGQKIEQVTHRYGTALRTEIRTASAGSAFTNLFKSRQHEIDYSREYPCRVVAQNPDGTLQLLPDDDVMKARGLDNVPIRYGIPGISAKVAPGARCHLSFAAGDPSRPFVGSWEYDPDKVVLNSIFDGAQSLARVGDLVTSGGPGLICTLTPVSLIGAPPNNAITMGMPCMITFSAIPAMTPAQQVPLYGAISSGIPKFQG